MHELASSLSPAADLARTCASRERESYDAIEELLHVLSAATRSTASAVAVVEGDVERSLVSLPSAPYCVARAGGAGAVALASSSALCLTYSELLDKGACLPIVHGPNTAFCVRGIGMGSGKVAILWMAREGSQPFSPRDVEAFEHTATLVKRELISLTRNEEFTVPKQRAAVEIPQFTTYGTRLQALVQNLDDGILVEDENRRVQICSNRLCDIMRLELPSEVHIHTDALALTSKMASICFIPEAFEESTAQLVEGNTANRRELIYLADMRIIERDYSPLSVHDRALGHLWVYRDVTQREQSKDLLQRQADQLRALSLVDDLTGLYNRRGFLTLATQQLKLCDRTLRPALVVFVDLDGMKRINDELGHEFGDQALTETANTMRQCFRYSDVLARLGGDEFVALAIDAAEDTASAIQARLYEKLAELNSKPGRPFELRFSVGIAPYDPTRAEMVEEVLARADSQMYEQKRARKAART